MQSIPEPLRIVAIDTSAANGSVAAVGDGVEVVERMPLATEHARSVAGAVVAVVERAGWTLDQVGCIGVVRGPGSFTGLRVGVTAAKAFAWTLSTRLVGVSAVEAIARQLRRIDAPGIRGPVSIVFDAGRGEVHASEVTFDGRDASEIVMAPGRLLSADTWIASLPPSTVVAGPALEKYAEAVARRGDVVIADREGWHPFAPAVAEAARVHASQNRFDDPRTLVPEYIRPSYAEEPRKEASAPPASSGGSGGAG